MKLNPLVLLLVFCSAHAFAADSAPLSSMAYLASEYHNPEEASITIDAPISQVWDYVSNSDNAREWSVYFRKIVACPLLDCPSNAELKPTDIGFVRRPYRQEDEQGVYWDEETIAIDITATGYNKSLRAYNFHGIAFTSGSEYLIENVFESLGPRTTRLTFRTHLLDLDHLTSPPKAFQYKIWETAGMFGDKKVYTIFSENLQNIKAAIENGKAYQRLFLYSL